MMKQTYPCPCCGLRAPYIGARHDDVLGVNYNKYFCNTCRLKFGTIETEQNVLRALLQNKGEKKNEK